MEKKVEKKKFWIKEVEWKISPSSSQENLKKKSFLFLDCSQVFF